MKRGLSWIINPVKIMVLKNMKKKILKRIDEASAIHKDMGICDGDSEMYRDYVSLMHKLKGELSVINELIQKM